MTNKAPFYAFLWLSITVLSRLKIKVCPKGLHNFAFYILIFDFSFRFLPAYKVGPRNPCNLCPRYPRLINNLRLRKITYEKIKLFLQNEPNFRKSQINVNSYIKRNYDQMDTWSIRKNEPKTNPNEPKTNPILANKTTIRTQTNPIQSQFIVSYILLFRSRFFGYNECVMKNILLRYKKHG